MSDETPIPKSEMDRKLQAWKALETQLKEQIAELTGKVKELQPLADRATAAETKLAEMELAATRDATFTEAGIVDARARKLLLTQFAADAAALPAGEAPLELKAFLDRAKEDPYLAPMFGAAPNGAAAGAGGAGAPAGAGGARGAGGAAPIKPVASPAGVTPAAPGPTSKRDFQAEINTAIKAGKLADAKKIREEWGADLAGRGALDTSRTPG